MATKFTPGPWSVFEWPGHQLAVVVDDFPESGPVTLANMLSMRVAGAKQANAQLIADAPLMYELLDRIVHLASINDHREAWDQAVGLLARHKR